MSLTIFKVSEPNKISANIEDIAVTDLTDSYGNTYIGKTPTLVLDGNIFIQPAKTSTLFNFISAQLSKCALGNRITQKFIHKDISLSAILQCIALKGNDIMLDITLYMSIVPGFSLHDKAQLSSDVHKLLCIRIELPGQTETHSLYFATALTDENDVEHKHLQYHVMSMNPSDEIKSIIDKDVTAMAICHQTMVVNPEDASIIGLKF